MRATVDGRGGQAAVSQAPSLPHVRALIAAVTRRDPGSIGDRDRLADLGMDSLDRVLMAVLVEERYGRTLSDQALTSIRTLADLHAHVQPEGERS
jgi:acyl carrier protein